MFDQIARQLAERQQEQRRRQFNPCPPGSMNPGAAPTVVLRFLDAGPQRWWRHCEIVLALGRSKGEVDWALRRLTELKLIDAEPVDPGAGRLPYKRYRSLKMKKKPG